MEEDLSWLKNRVSALEQNVQRLQMQLNEVSAKVEVAARQATKPARSRPVIP